MPEKGIIVLSNIMIADHINTPFVFTCFNPGILFLFILGVETIFQKGFFNNISEEDGQVDKQGRLAFIAFTVERST